MIKRRGGNQIGLFDSQSQIHWKQGSNEVQLERAIHHWKYIFRAIKQCPCTFKKKLDLKKLWASKILGQQKCRNPTLRQMWGWNSHSQKWELGILRDSQNFRARLQGSKHLTLRCSFYVGKVLKCRCRKWPRMSHSDICSTSYGRKKGWESNWQFDSQPLKVGNRLDPGVYRWSATHRWKALEESYKFSLDLIPITGLS